MATTNRKRRKTKHRGNAAGMVEARGKTSASSRQATPGKGGRRNRFDEPPTWRGALNRALFAAALFGILIVIAFGRPIGDGIALAGLMVFMYLPMSYYTDKFLYNRRQRQKQAGRG